MKIKSILLTLLLAPLFLVAQEGAIVTKEGRPVLEKYQMISSCLKGLHKDRNDKTALSICECQISKLNRAFTSKQITSHTRGRVIDIQRLIDNDSVVSAAIKMCYKASGKTMLLQAEGFQVEFVEGCKEDIRKNTERSLDPVKLDNYCNCQVNLIKTKKLTDAEIETLNNPNSLLSYEVRYTCGYPFVEKERIVRNWNEAAKKDVDGPTSDTLGILTLDGMTYVKMKTGSLLQFWLFDTGASDLLINNDMEATLKSEGVITDSSYLGTGEYEMANGAVDTCRKYLISNVRIGKFSVDNVIVAVTDKGKRIIAGKSLLNKFSNWILDNKTNTLILNR